MGIDLHIHDTYFIVAHFHYVMVGGMVMAFMGGLHFWWPKMTGKMYDENWAKLSAALVFIGFNLTFFPQFILGYLGMPRRYAAYPEEFQVLHVLSTAGATVLAAGYLLPAFYFTDSLLRGKKAPPNPYNAKGLEWEIPSPPPTENFTTIPVVTEEVYAYAEAKEEKTLV
jgi:cytochrome c oxidase subunit 1